MEKGKKIGDLYNMSLFKWFLWAGAPLFIFLFVLIVVMIGVIPFLSGSDLEYVKGLLGLFIGLVVCAALLSYGYPLIGIIRLKKQEFIIHKRYSDRMKNGLNQAKYEWFICLSGARLIVYHRDYIRSIEKEVQEKRKNDTSSVMVYLIYIKNCRGNGEKITFLFREDAEAFKDWFQS